MSDRSTLGPFQWNLAGFFAHPVWPPAVLGRLLDAIERLQEIRGLWNRLVSPRSTRGLSLASGYAGH